LNTSLLVACVTAVYQYVEHEETMPLWDTGEACGHWYGTCHTADRARMTLDGCLIIIV